MNKDVWSYFKHFGRLLGKIFSDPHSQQDWRRGSQPARCTLSLQPDLLGSFPADVGHRAKFSPSGGRGRSLIGNWVWPKGYIHPFSGDGVGGGGEAKRFLTDSAQQLSYTSNHLRHPQFSNFQGHIILSKSPSQQKFAWRRDILRNRFIGCPCQGNWARFYLGYLRVRSFPIKKIPSFPQMILLSLQYIS